MLQVIESTVEFNDTRETIPGSLSSWNRPEPDLSSGWMVLIPRIAKGDPAAFAAFYDESSVIAFNFILHIVHNTEVAEATLFDVYERVRQDAASYDARKEKPLLWLLRLSRRIAVDRPATSVQNAVDFETFRQKRLRVNSAVGQLSEEQCAFLQMTYFGGINAPEVADLLELPVEYVRKQICMGMNRLRMHLRSTTSAVAF